MDLSATPATISDVQIRSTLRLFSHIHARVFFLCASNINLQTFLSSFFHKPTSRLHSLPIGTLSLYASLESTISLAITTIEHQLFGTTFRVSRKSVAAASHVSISSRVGFRDRCGLHDAYILLRISSTSRRSDSIVSLVTPFRGSLQRSTT